MKIKTAALDTWPPSGRKAYQGTIRERGAQVPCSTTSGRALECKAQITPSARAWNSTTTRLSKGGLLKLQKLAITLLLCACSVADAQPGAATKHDGGWWKSLPKDQQDGFVSGYLDCYVFDAKAKVASNK